jgi:hypothetical protein
MRHSLFVQSFWHGKTLSSFRLVEIEFVLAISTLEFLNMISVIDPRITN